ncbi:GM16325 [Drosophila sechellia]|uniref:GD18062 n=2 Tax=melanogaster subgroup TaxID=32351 RepID=B4QY38_DROSI|nr:GM16325 [Drosophila sechellia]EDX14686.1 GD18062 [Drosophila simulans]
MNAPMCVCAPHFRPLFSAPYTSLLPAGAVV